MDPLALFNQITNLPDEAQAQAADFIQFLSQKYAGVPNSRKAVFGSGSGLFLIQPGFDESIGDFKEHLH